MTGSIQLSYLVGTQTFSSGVVVLTYQLPAGAPCVLRTLTEGHDGRRSDDHLHPRFPLSLLKAEGIVLPRGEDWTALQPEAVAPLPSRALAMRASGPTPDVSGMSKMARRADSREAAYDPDGGS